MAISGNSAGSNFAAMKLTLTPPLILCLGCCLVILVGSGIFYGRFSKECPAPPMVSNSGDSIRLKLENEYLLKLETERDIYTAKLDSARAAWKKRTIKQQVSDEIPYLRSLPLDSLVQRLLAAPVEPPTD